MDIHAMLRDRKATNAERTAERARIQRRIDNAQARIAKLPTISHLDVLKEIAAAIQERMPDRQVETLGPFGLGSETAIHVKDGKTITASLSFQPDDDHPPALLIIDRDSQSPYPANSIGRMNGLGRRTLPLPATVDELVTDLRAQESARRDAA